ncbi:MAG: neutral/alkaline non-lysosomal ceramidase N-terminal domain-containing protein [Clostridia bacterium]|nr:neutral/alkaline non-lysosomal ceramidase N-terminal domain-containing protein [Clostridia bacterium]
MNPKNVLDTIFHKKAAGRLISAVTGRMAKNAGKRFAAQPPARIPEEDFIRSPEPSSDLFTVGFGKAEIMPKERIPGEKKYYIAGYRDHNPAVGVLDPLQAKAVWIDDNSGLGAVVMVAVDCVGLMAWDVGQIKKRVWDFVGGKNCRSLNILATHDHAGIDTMGMWGPVPKTGRDPEFMEIVARGVLDAVKKAYEDRRAGRLYLGYAHVPREWIRRDRTPHHTNERIARFRFEPEDGSRQVYICNFASHSESLEGKNSLVSGDFPAYIAEEVMREKGAETIYFVADICGVRMWPQDDDNVVSCIKTGRGLGMLICAIPEDEDHETKLVPRIGVCRREFYAPCDNPVLMAAIKIKLMKAHPYDIGGGDLGMGVKTEITYIEIGQARLLLLPGEIMPDLVYGTYLPAEETAEGLPPTLNPEPLCEIAGDKDLMIFGLANDEIGYIVTPNDFYLDPDLPYIESTRDRLDRRHYEETNGLGPRTAYLIADNFKAIMRKVKADV